ncbi:MAG: hypothetical protein ABSC06_09170 [Rhodopila sp.]|jgi:hypothetical protein
MKTLVLAAVAAVTLSVGVANAASLSQATPQQNSGQYEITAGAAGWG